MQKLEIENLLDTRQLDAAEKRLQTSDLSSVDALSLKIRLLFLQNKYDEALAVTAQMLHDIPNSPVAYRWKAEILDDGFHNFKESIECSSKAIEIDPNYAEAYVVRGNTKRWMTPSDNEGAIEDYNEAIKCDKNNATAHNGLGWALLEFPEKIDEALKYFTTALCLDANTFAAYQGISVVFYRKKQLDKAIEYINKAIALNPEEYYLYQSRALYKSSLKEPPTEEICDDHCLALTKSPCKKDFNFTALFDAAYASGQLNKVADILWGKIGEIPQREDILDFHLHLFSTAQDESLNLILSKGIPAEYQSPTGRIFFHELIALYDCETIKKVKFSKELLHKTNEQGLTPLAIAVRSNKINTGKYLLSLGSSADETIAFPWMTPLAMAITTNKMSWINLFLKSGVNINRPLKKIGSYLSLACSLGHWEIATKILEHGANPNNAGLDGCVPPLRFCDIDKNSVFLEKILEKGARLEYAPLTSAKMIKKRSEEIKQNLILDVNAETDSRFSLFCSYLRQEELSDKEWKKIKKAINTISPALSCDENRRFAINALTSCPSTDNWPQNDSYILLTLPPQPAIKKECKEKTTEKKTENNTTTNTTTNTANKTGQVQKKQICPEVVWIGFIPFWISTKSFIGALLITMGAYVVLYIIKYAMGGNSR